MFVVRCSIDGKKWWYYAGRTRENGKVVPVFITEKEYRNLAPIEYVTQKNDFLRLNGASDWKYIHFIKEK